MTATQINKPSLKKPARNKQTKTHPSTDKTVTKVLSNSLASLREARIKTLGLAVYPPELILELKEQALEIGELLDEKKPAKGPKKKQGSGNTEKSKKASAQTSHEEQSLFSRFVSANRDLKHLIQGSARLLDDARKEMIEDAIAKGQEIKKHKPNTPQNKKSGPVKNNKAQAKVSKRSDSRLKQQTAKFLDFRRGFSPTLAARMENIYEEFIETRKSVDFERRHKAALKRQQRRERIERILQRVGLVSRLELEDLNKRFANLVESVAQITSEEDRKTLMALERRNRERRTAQASMQYESRVYGRRNSDRQAA